MHVVITGAATGIGAASFRTLEAQGARITAIDIAPPQDKGGATWITADLCDPAAVSSAVAQIDSPVDALINSAGLPPRAGLAARVLALNTLALRSFTDAMIPRMSSGGSIVHVASRAGSAWQENLDQVRGLLALHSAADLPAFIEKHRIDDTRAYFLSKEAVVVMTLGQTEDLLAKGLRVNCVSPAAVDTALLPDFMTAFGERATKGVARAGRAGSADEIGRVIAFLASPESGWIRGANLPVDGGISAMVESDHFNLAD